MGGNSHMKTKYLLIISIFVILMSMTGISASENVNQTDSLGLSVENNFEIEMKMKYWERIFMLETIHSKVFQMQLPVQNLEILFI